MLDLQRGVDARAGEQRRPDLIAQRRLRRGLERVLLLRLGRDGKERREERQHAESSDTRSLYLIWMDLSAPRVATRPADASKAHSPSSCGGIGGPAFQNLKT